MMHAINRMGTRSGLLLLVCAVLAACAGFGPPAAPAAGESGKSSTWPRELSSEDKDVMAALMAGEFAWQDGRAAIAARHFARAAAASDDPTIAEHATRVAVVAQEWELARQGLLRWRGLAAGAVEQIQADLSIALGEADSDAATVAANRLLAGNEDEGSRLLGQALLTSSGTETATALLERLADRDDLPDGAQTRMLLSQVAQQLRQAALALRLAKMAVSSEPDSAAARLWLGHVHLRAGDKPAARVAFERAVDLAPTDKAIRLTYAAFLNDLGDPVAAANTLNELAADDELLAARAAYAARSDDPALLSEVLLALESLPEPRPVARIELLGQVAELAKRRDDALRWYREIPRGERWIDAQMRIAVILDADGKHEAALAHLDQLRSGGIDDDARLVETFLLEAELHTLHKNTERALETFTRGLRVLPDDRRLLYGRGLLYERMDRIDECEADLRRIVQLHPEDPDALNALGYTLADRTDRKLEALALIEKALAAKPDEPAIIDSMGWVQFKMGNYEQALEYLRRAFELQPDAEIAAHLGEVLWATDAREQAREIWASGRELDPENATLEKTVSRLDK